MAYLDSVFTDSSQALKTVMVFSKSLTPAAVGASIGMKEENFTAMGAPQPMRTTDLVFVTPPPGATAANISVVGARATGADAITLIQANLTAAANQATAGVYGFLVLRP